MVKHSGKVRSIEVAALARASASTVSRVLSGDKRISQATRERVLAAAAELGYQPNLIARSLKNSSTGIVGVVVTDLDNLYHAHTLKLLIDEMGDRGLAPLVFACHKRERASTVISRLMSYQVDAVIALAAPFSAEIVKSCQSAGKPVVLMNRYDGTEEISLVAGDGIKGGALVADHLAAAGARRFAFFAGEDHTRISSDREHGFKQRLSELGHDCSLRAASAYLHAAAFKAATELLEERPDAVFCANDTLAFALMDAARHSFGLRVPQDLTIVGYDNSELAAWPSYNLTSVDQSLEEMTLLAVQETLALISDPEFIPTRRMVTPKLVVRGSTHF